MIKDITRPSVVALLATDLQRTILHHLPDDIGSASAYTAFGYNLINKEKFSFLGFGGELRTKQGSYLLGNGYRSYSPYLMRFHSPDQLSPFGAGGLNSYVFADQDPINNQDPSGRFSIPVKWNNTSRLRQHFESVASALTGVSKRYSGDAKNVDGFTMFMSEHPSSAGERAITVKAHGSSTMGPTGAITKGKKNWDAGYFLKKANEAGFKTEQYDIHLIACETANRTLIGPSFIQQVADITKRRAFGYYGEVFEQTYDMKPLSNKTSVFVMQRDRIWWLTPGLNYQPAFASPRTVRQSEN